LKKHAEENIEDWVHNKINNIPMNWHLPTFLRLNPDKKKVQTSKGAIVSVDNAKLLYGLLKKCRKNDQEHKPKESIKIDFYQYRGIEKVDETFIVCVGCHRISSQQVDRFIKDFNLDW
jgi:hypothetical protein